MSVRGLVNGDLEGGLTVIAEFVLVQDAALALPCYVCYPDAADVDAILATRV